MTESEWQALDARIAREVMGYSHSYAHGAVCWSYPVGPRRGVIIPQNQWRPDRNVSQAMLVLKTLLKNIGCYAEAELHMRILPSRCRVTIQNWVATDGVPTGFVRSPYVENEMQAICLAAKEWMNTYGHKTNPAQS